MTKYKAFFLADSGVYVVFELHLESKQYAEEQLEDTIIKLENKLGFTFLYKEEL